jgi:LysR family transcriptional regulator, transcriptional activator of nhaA
MEWLNYHHLLYFWMVAREGSVTAAAKELRLAHPTVSGQIHRLEDVLGEKLFVQRGRKLVLTDAGRVAYRYADEIFSLGREFMGAVKGRSTGRQLRVVVGVSDVIAKSIVHRILEPAFRLEESVRVVCRESRSLEAFMGELAMNTVDVVLSDAPAGPGTPVRTFNHLLGECGTSFFAAPALARRCRRKFPGSMDGAPVLLPGSDSTFRRALNEWFDARDIHPTIAAELDDVALATVLGEAGIGVFAVPDVIEAELRQRYEVELVGRANEIRQRFYAISLERKLKNPAVVAICELARRKLFV